MNSVDLGSSETKKSTADVELGVLFSQLQSIGVARFVGRINSGVIEPEAGYKCVEMLVEAEEKRPWVSRISHLLTGHSDTFTKA